MKVNYQDYLRLETLLGCQHPVSDPLIHDEMLFIITHQSFELWFKIIIDEICETKRLINGNKIAAAIPHVKRISAVAELFPAKLKILETMAPQEFLKFRDQLMPASGLQSFQFRRVEFLMNAQDERHLKLYEGEKKEQLIQDAKDNVWTALMNCLLNQYGMDTSGKEQQLKAIETIYNNTDYLIPKLLCEALIEADEAFRKWRYHHALMAERMIGLKSGTGKAHTSAISGDKSFSEGGVRYLQIMAEKKFFPVLWEVRTILSKGTY